MRVLVLSASFPPMRSGGADYTFRLCKNLAASGHDIHVLTSTIDQVATDPTFRVWPIMRRWSWSEFPRLLRLVRRAAPDVVNIHFHGQLYHNHPMITFVPTLVKRSNSGIRVVTHIEYPAGVRLETLSHPARAAWKVVARLVGRKDVDGEYGTILRDSDQIIVLSDTHRTVLSQHFAGVDLKSVLMPPPPLIRVRIDTDGEVRREGRRLVGAAPHDFVLAYFGYQYPGKGIETLFEVVRHLKQQGRAARLVMIGGSNEIILKEMNRPHYSQELRDLADRLCIRDIVVWSGYFPSESDQPSVYLRAADACVLPFDEGVYLNNSSVAAAAAHGLPIVTTKGRIVEGPFRDGQNVLLCRPKDSASVSVAIERLITDVELQQRLSAGALELAHEWFSWNRTLERTIDIFAGTFASHPAGPSDDQQVSLR